MAYSEISMINRFMGSFYPSKTQYQNTGLYVLKSYLKLLIISALKAPYLIKFINSMAAIVKWCNMNLGSTRPPRGTPGLN